jgi:hypothetical protein
VSVAATPTGAPAGATAASAQQAEPARAPGDSACPLCGAPLAADQEWCLGCGAAARTRLAAPTSWKTPILAVALVAALALGALAAALVSLTGKSGSIAPPPAITRTIATPGLGLGGSAGSGTGAATTPGGAVGGVTAPAAPGAVGTPTTISPSRPSGTAGTSTTPGAAGTHPSTGSRAEEALRKAGFVPRGGQ